MSGEPISSIVLLVCLPILVTMLLGAALLIALRGGRPLKFSAKGFGVSINLSSESPPPSGDQDVLTRKR